MTASHSLPTEAINYSQPGTVAGGGDVVGLTIGQAARVLGLPESTLQFWVARRGCPTVRRGGRRRCRPSLDGWARSARNDDGDRARRDAGLRPTIARLAG